MRETCRVERKGCSVILLTSLKDMITFLPAYSIPSLILGPCLLGTFGTVVDLLSGAQCNLKALWMRIRSSWVLVVFRLQYYSMISRRDGLGADIISCVSFPPVFTFRAQKTKVEISRRSGLHWLNELPGMR